MREVLFKWIVNSKAREENQEKTDTGFFSREEIEKVRGFHRKFKEYAPTPLFELNDFAAHIGVKKIWVKDESHRFGLNAFKVLGASYAMGRFLAKELNVSMDEISFDDLKEETTKKLGQITFVTATDGNHGRAVAWAAKMLGQRAVVYLPKGSSAERLNAILETGAQGSITDLNYDDTVRLAANHGQKYGWQLIQDTAWEGYEEIPKWIMQGYAVMAHEIQEQLKEQNIEKPTHILLQAGVGSFAGAIEGYYANLFGEVRPVAIIMEPKNAACIYNSALINDGDPHGVVGDLETIMAGLACGEPNPIGWEILRDYADAYFSCEDDLTEKGMRILANPLEGDPKIISGESGAVGIGFITELLETKKYSPLMNGLKLNEDAKILIISTEGDTDKDNYRKILWG